jgi:phosphoribosyl-ATP pyrophosphohydrolase/phosphoribosyl-AMP cyclohydrolase
MSDKYSIIDNLYHTIVKNSKSDPNLSYTAKLFKKGENTILKKIGEEATELVCAFKDKNRSDIVCASADLVYHTLVALAFADINPELIKTELKKREGVSGIAEKNSRKE